MAWTRQDIAFPAHDGLLLRGLLLRGWLYLPKGIAPTAGVVMSHGFTATKEMGLAGFAEVFAQAGIAVLAYDHRALGASEGEPRSCVDAWVQSRDMLAAIAWLAVRPEVDSQRIGLWGTSFSGGEALVVGAIDPAVRAVVAVVTVAGDPAAPEVGKAEGLAALADRVRSARVPSALRDVRTVIPEEDSDDPGLMGVSESIDWFRAESVKSEGRWRNHVLLPADPGPVVFNPAVAVPHLNGPALFIVASGDRLAEAEAAKTAAMLAPEGSELLVIDGHHFTLYSGAPLAQSATAARDFFLRAL